MFVFVRSGSLGLISLQPAGGLGGVQSTCGVGPAGNNLANAHARVALPIRTLSRTKPQPAGPVESTSTLRAASSPLIDLHTRNDVSGDGDPPLPACAAVADSARSAITVSIPKTRLLVMMTFPSPLAPACEAAGVEHWVRVIPRHLLFERRGLRQRLTAEWLPPVWR